MKQFCVVVAVFVVIVVFFVTPIQGGMCWMGFKKNGRCRSLAKSNVSKEQCCSEFPGVSTGWSEENLSSSSLFFHIVAKDGISCMPCKNSCDGVECEHGRVCVVRKGRAKCICSPCRKKDKSSFNPVCGNDGNTYSSLCHLERTACRQRKQTLRAAYNGNCKDSCKDVECLEEEHCVVDQNLTPHCVTCALGCYNPREKTMPVCGVDGITYENVCVLRQTACVSGKAIPVAYEGNCMENATCENITCEKDQLCLTDPSTGFPRCSTCETHCAKGIAKQLGGPICGTNNKTYRSWCHMQLDACKTKTVIDTKSNGSCPGRK